MTFEPIATLGPGSLVGAYRIVKEIGRGGMATVYEAAHTILPRRAALKIMHADLLRQSDMATRLVQEAAILECARHPGVVRVYECCLLPDRRPWIAMELLEGETLANRLRDASILPAVEVAALLSHVADVLATFHSTGVIHRDLKPDNLLCTPTNLEYPLRVLDWGVARLALIGRLSRGQLGRLTLEGLTPGTPIYMSPEQATGRDVAAPCDIYSLGVIAYEALTGSPPFAGHTLAEVICMHLTRPPAPLGESCNAPPELRDLVGRMLQKDPAMRPGAIEVRQVGRAITQGLEAYGRPGATRDRVRPLPRIVPTLEDLRVDADALEYGTTEMLPAVLKPRWVPEIGQGPSTPGCRSEPQLHAITPSLRQDRSGDCLARKSSLNNIH